MDAPQHDLRLLTRLDVSLGPAPLVAASDAKLGQVFLNLLINATQAIPEGDARAHRRLMIIDDEPRLLHVLAISLTDEHDVVTAEGCEAALRIIGQDGHFDAILCDLMMPLGDRMIFYAGAPETPLKGRIHDRRRFHPASAELPKLHPEQDYRKTIRPRPTSPSPRRGDRFVQGVVERARR